MAQQKNRWLAVPLFALALAAVGAFFWLRQTSPATTPASAGPEATTETSTPDEASAQAPTDAQSEAQSGAQANSPAPQATVNQEDRRARVLSRLWWNRPKHYEPIGLDAELRARMDERMSRFLDYQREQNSQRRTFRAFRRALTDGDWPAARESIPALTEANSEPLRLQAEAMVDIMEMLSPEQHQRLIDDHAGLLAGPWMSSRGIGGDRRRPPTNSP